MTTQPERPDQGTPADRAETEHLDAGTDPMHPHPQDRPPGQESDRTQQDGSQDDTDDDTDDAGLTDDATDDARLTDDDSPVDRYGESPGQAASRPMDAPGDVPEPNEPA